MPYHQLTLCITWLVLAGLKLITTCTFSTLISMVMSKLFRYILKIFKHLCLQSGKKVVGICILRMLVSMAKSNIQVKNIKASMTTIREESCWNAQSICLQTILPFRVAVIYIYQIMLMSIVMITYFYAVANFNTSKVKVKN